MMIHKKFGDDISKCLHSMYSDYEPPILYNGKITKSAILAVILDFSKNHSTSFRDMSISVKNQDGRQSAILNPATPIFNRVLKVHPKMIQKKFGDDISKRLRL